MKIGSDKSTEVMHACARMLGFIEAPGSESLGATHTLWAPPLSTFQAELTRNGIRNVCESRIGVIISPFCG